MLFLQIFVQAGDSREPRPRGKPNPNPCCFASHPLLGLAGCSGKPQILAQRGPSQHLLVSTGEEEMLEHPTGTLGCHGRVAGSGGMGRGSWGGAGGKDSLVPSTGQVGIFSR